MNLYQRWKRRLRDWYGLRKIPRVECDVAALPELAAVTLDFAALISGPRMAVARLRAEGAPICVRPLGRLPREAKLNSNITSPALAYRTPPAS